MSFMRTPPSNEAFRNEFDRVFKKKASEDAVEVIEVSIAQICHLLKLPTSKKPFGSYIEDGVLHIMLRKEKP